MGYTTEFKGTFTLTPALTMEQYADLDAIENEKDAGNGSPDGYFQWKPTRNGKGIQWDGGEKFYDYVEWLQWLIDAKLTPWGITLSGQVTYSGESRGDVGILRVVDGKAVKVDASKPSESVLAPHAKAMYEILTDELRQGNLSRDAERSAERLVEAIQEQMLAAG